MPRTARIKSPESVYHIMSRSIGEIDLFRTDKDKNTYLKYIKKYKDIFSFKLYSFCLMSNHVHLLIDSNGADVSKFMHCINQSYSQYYNKKHNRHGHLFGDRFKSKIAHNDVSVMCISAYIHNNPKDIRGYKNCVENYLYSSFGIYIGKHKHFDDILDKDFILKYFNQDPILAISKYVHFTKSRSGMDAENVDLSSFNFQFSDDLSNYRSYKSHIMKGISPQDIVIHVTKLYGFSESDLHIKYNHKSCEFRALCVLLIRNLCDLNLSQICDYIGNITLSSLSYLCNKGYHIIKNEPKYHLILDKIVQEHKLRVSSIT